MDTSILNADGGDTAKKALAATEKSRRRSIVEQIAADIHDYSINKGFWPLKAENLLGPGDVVSSVRTEGLDLDQDHAQHYTRNFGEALMLVCTELAEAMEGFRSGDIELDDPEKGPMIEIGDAIIRLLDLGYGIGGDTFVRLMMDKIAINDKRPHLHGKKF